MSRSARPRGVASWGVAGATGVLLWFLIAAPSLGILTAAFQDLHGHPSFVHWQAASQLAGATLVTSLVVLASGAAATIVGVPLALLLALFQFPGRRLVMGLVVLPVTLPPLVGTLAVYKLGGPHGMLPGLAAALGHDPPPELVGWIGVLAVHTLTMYPIVYGFCLAALARVDASRLEAARVHGAGPVATWWRVLLPALRPALAASGALVAMTSLASFSAPLYFLQPHQPFLTLVIYTTRETDPSRSILGTLLLFLMALVVLAVFVLLEGRTPPPLTRGAPRPLLPRRAPVGRLVVGPALWGFTILVLLPQLAVCHLALAEGWSHREPVPLRLTLRHLLDLVRDPALLQPVLCSLWMAVAAVLVALLLGFAAAWWRRRTRIPGRGFVEALCMLPFALPGTVLGLAMLRHFNQPWGLGLVPPIAGTALALPVAYAVRVLPLTYRGACAGLAGLDPALEEAAAALGARPFARLRRIVLPALAPALGVAALLSFLTAAGEFPASILLSVPGSMPVSVKINTLMRQHTSGPPFALGVMLIGLQVLVVLLAARLAGGRRQRHTALPRGASP